MRETSLYDWTLNFKVSLVALCVLITLLSHPLLPSDATTLLKTKTVYNVQVIVGGAYYKFFKMCKIGLGLESRIWGSDT